MIRKVKKEDYNEIAKLMMKAFKLPPWNEDWTFERALERIKQLDNGDYTRCYIYLSGNKILGVFCGRFNTFVDKNEMVIEDFYIDPDYQRLGVGSEFIKTIIEQLDNIDYVTLLTGRSFYSVDFYKKNGFEIQDSKVYMYKKVK